MLVKVSVSEERRGARKERIGPCMSVIPATVAVTLYTPTVHTRFTVCDRVGREGEREGAWAAQPTNKKRERNQRCPATSRLSSVIAGPNNVVVAVPLRPPTTDCGPHHGAFCSCRFYGDEPGLSHQGLTWSAQGLTPHSGAIWGNREPRPRCALTRFWTQHRWCAPREVERGK